MNSELQENGQNSEIKKSVTFFLFYGGNGFYSLLTSCLLACLLLTYWQFISTSCMTIFYIPKPTNT